MITVKIKRPNPNILFWEYIITDNSASNRVVKSGRFEGSPAQLREHIKSTYQKKRPNALSGAQLYYPADRYTITCQARIVF